MDWRVAERTVWAALGRLASVEPGGVDCDEVLFGLDLDRLRDDPEFRASVRQEVLVAGERLWDRGRERVWELDFRTVTHRVKMLLPWDEDEHRTRARSNTLALGLMHPNDGLVRFVVEVVRAERERRRPLTRMTEPAALAAAGGVDELADEWVRHWVDWGNAAGPADRDLVEDGMRRCYQLWGQPWHGRVVWVDSPFAAGLVAWLRSPTLWTTDAWLSTEGNARSWAYRRDDLRARMDLDLTYVVGGDLFGRAGAVGDAVWLRLDLRAALEHLLGGGSSQSGSQLGAADPALVRRALERVGDQVPGVAPEHLRAMLDAVESDQGPAAQSWYPRIHGQLVAPWLARATLIERLCRRRPAGSLWDRLAAYRDANAAGPWTAHADYAVVSDRPVIVRCEHVEVPGQRQPRRQLHAENGPAVVWADETAGYVVHGTALPFDLMRHGWSAARILDERNTELRRIAIERLGWDRFLAEADLTLVHGPVPDPGNPGNTLSLYDLPTGNVAAARLLVCTNASPERDGTVRRFGLQVPATVDDAVAAAAWTFNVDPDTYRRLLRAT